MINFRFHLVSLVAIFLALGVGVAMGASFVDRATVDSLRSRVDDLSDSYRRRGEELAATKDQLAQLDAEAKALAGEGSEALFEKLRGQPLVLIAPDGISDDLLSGPRSSLTASGALAAGSLLLKPGLALTDGDVVRQAGDRLGLPGKSPDQVREQVVNGLGAALGILAEDADGALPADDAVTTTTEARTGTTVAGGLVEPPTDPASARSYLTAMTELGLIAIDNSEASPGVSFPTTVGVRYLMVLPATSKPDDTSPAIPLARSLSDSAGAVLTVAETRPARSDGEPTTTGASEPKRGSMLAELRESESADRLSTIDNLDEDNGRIAMVFAVSEQSSGRVGHYGTGTGAIAPFPTVPSG